MIAFDDTILYDCACVKYVCTIANLRTFYLIVLNPNLVPFVNFMMNTFQFKVVTLILLKFVANYFEIRQGKLRYQNAFALISVEEVFLDQDFEIVRGVLIALDLNTADMVYSEVTLLYLNYTGYMFIHAI